MNKYSPEEKIKLVKKIIEEKQSINSLSVSSGIDHQILRDWIRNYQSIRPDVFYKKGWTKRTLEEKKVAVRAYLDSNDSLETICRKYKISDTRTLRQWIMKYNSHEKLKAYTGESTIMTKGRKNTLDERVEIVQYCIEHNRNYAKAAEKYQVSYQQARNYTVKYESDGIEALRDNRGKRKSKDEMTELERLRAKNRILKAEKKYAEMQVSFLKKLEEIERRRG